MTSHQKWMQLAIEQAIKGNDVGEVPVGAIIVKNDKVISQSFNNPILKNDPTAHAEILAIRSAVDEVGNYRLTGATLYVTLEPCAMCYGAIVHARISNLVFGAYDYKTGVCGSSFNLHEQKFFNHAPKITGGVLEEECSILLKNFFKERRN